MRELDLEECEIGAEAAGRLIRGNGCSRMVLEWENEMRSAGAKAIADACGASQNIDLLEI